MRANPLNVARWLALSGLILLTSCVSVQQSQFPLSENKYSPKPNDFEVAVYRDELPGARFERIARLDVHFEKTHFLGSSYEKALEKLKKQARQVGADAIVEIEERRSGLNETKIYHVTATAIVFE